MNFNIGIYWMKSLADLLQNALYVGIRTLTRY